MTDTTDDEAAAKAAADAAAAKAAADEAAAKAAVDEAAAKAAADEAAAKAAAAAKPRRGRRAKAQDLDLPRLKRLAADIEARAHHHLLDQLLTDLKGEEGLVVDADELWTTVTLAGITAQSQSGLHGGLRNWAMAARRATLDVAVAAAPAA